VSDNRNEQQVWDYFRRSTRARIGLARAGNSMPTTALLDFQLACAQAKDAVHGHADFDLLEKELAPFPCVQVSSQVTTRSEYLQRPDLGRKLSSESRERLEARRSAAVQDVVFVVCDGLSAAALMSHAVQVLEACLSRLQGWETPCVVLARHGRVALGDEIAQALGCRMAVVLIGERPGLSSPDSLGIYLTWAPAPGTQDSQRNCISNIHASGLSPAVAAEKAVWLIREATRLRLTGTGLKEDFPALPDARAAPNPALTHHGPEVPSSASRPSAPV